MPQAVIAAAVWVGSSAAFGAVALGASTVVAATVGYAAIGATLAAELYAINKAQKLLAPKLGTGGDGASVEWKANPRAGIPYAIGRCKVGGNIVFVQSAGASNKYINFVTVYTGAGPIDSYEQFLADDVAVNFTADSGEGAGGFYLNRMWMKRQLGAPGDSWLRWTATGSKDTPANHGGMPTEWTSGHLMTGYAASLWGLEYDANKYSGGRPAHAMVGKWVKVYDPRKDSTYPGGSGTHRAGDETTYEWSANPYLHALTWVIGRYQNGVKILGLGLPVSKIDVPAFVQGANVSDANAWTCHGLVYSTDDKAEVLKAFLQAGAGKVMLLNNKLSCFVNTPRVSLATIRSKDVIGEVTVSSGQSKTDRINMIWPTYTEESQNWERTTPEDAVAVPEYFAEDGGERQTEIDYVLVADVIQAAQLARYDIEDSRELSPISLPCKPAWQGYKPGDCITANEPEWGLNGQKLLILSRKFDPITLTTVLTCRTETDGKHAFALGQTATPPDTPALTGIDLFPPAPSVDDWTVVGTTFVDNGMKIPAIVIEGARGSPSAKALLVRFRPDGSTDWAVGPVTPLADDGPVKVELTAGLTRGTVYEVSIAYRSDRGLDGAWTSLGSVAAGEFSLEEIDELISDGDLSPRDKLYVIPWIQGIVGRRTPLRTRANALNLTVINNTPRANYETAASALDAQLATLTTPVAWNNPSDKTTIPDPAAFRTALTNAQTTGDALQAEIDRVYKAQIDQLFTDTGAGDTTPPATPTGLSYTAAFASIFLTWNDPTDVDMDKIEIWEATVNSLGSASKIATVAARPGGGNSYVRSGLGEGVTRYYWIRAVDKARNVSGFTASLAATTAALPLITETRIATDAISSPKIQTNALLARHITAGIITADKIVVNEIDTQYIRNGALANAGYGDAPQYTSISETPYTLVSSGGMNIELRNSGGSYTTVVLLFYLEGANNDTSIDAGLYGDVVLNVPGAGLVTLTGTGILLRPGNPGNFCVPLYYRTPVNGMMAVVAGAYAQRGSPGVPTSVVVTRCKIVPLAIFKS